MNTVGSMLKVRRVLLALALILIVVFVAANVSFAAGGGVARWAALGSGISPQAVAGPDDNYLLAFDEPGTVGPDCDFPDPINYTSSDAIFWYAKHQCWIKWFGGEASGLTSGQDINALHDECGPTEPRCDIYLSFEQKSVKIPGVGSVRANDIVRASWAEIDLQTYNDWLMFFDGSDVGLSTVNEKIDALFILDPEDTPNQWADCGQVMLLSTNGAYSVPNVWGGWLTGGGEDLIGFCGSSFGWDTVGGFFPYHDGSAEGAPANSINALAHEDARTAFNRFDFMTKGDFNVDDAHGGASDVFQFWAQTDMYKGPLFSIDDDLGIWDKVDSFHIYYTE